jgi:hypothetical protein
MKSHQHIAVSQVFVPAGKFPMNRLLVSRILMNRPFERPTPNADFLGLALVASLRNSRECEHGFHEAHLIFKLRDRVSDDSQASW